MPNAIREVAELLQEPPGFRAAVARQATGRWRHRRLSMLLWLTAVGGALVAVGSRRTPADGTEPLVLAGGVRPEASPGVTAVVAEDLPGRSSLRGVDWIIARGLHCVDSESRDVGASDHAVVCASLDLVPMGFQAKPWRATSRGWPGDHDR